MISKILSFAKKKVAVPIDVNAIIEQIHQEFFTASDQIVKEANRIINNLPVTNADKASRLRSIGFGNTSEAVVDLQRRQMEGSAQRKLENVMYFSNTYPQYRYIDNDAIDRICTKYNLVFGKSNRYKGFVPEKNLREIERFKIKEEDCFYTEETPYRTHEIDFEEYKKPEANMYGIHLYRRKSMDSTLYICAPLKDMDTENAKVVGNRIIEFPDPIVLRRVRSGGYLILTAWGAEASDPEVINSKMN